MAQHRKPPAYMEYAASMLSNKHFRLMSLKERGLLYTLRLECWENIHVPATIHELTKYLGCEVNEIQEALTKNVMSFLLKNDSNITCPELDDYRQHLNEIRARQIAGGKYTAAIKKEGVNKSRKHTNSIDSANHQANLQVSYQETSKSLVQQSTEKQSQTQSLEQSPNNNDWANDYDEADSVIQNSYSSYANVKG